MEIKINTTVKLPDNNTRHRIEKIVKHIQEVLVKYELGIIPSTRDDIKNAILGEEKSEGVREYEEAYLTYIPYMFWFYHVDGSSWTTDELYGIWDWLW
jgi:hypothetical protein